MLEPAAHDRPEPVSLEPVKTAAPGAPDRDQTGLFQHPQVACRRGPAMRETLGEIARRQFAAERFEQNQNFAAYGMGEGTENGILGATRGPAGGR